MLGFERPVHQPRCLCSASPSPSGQPALPALPSRRWSRRHAHAHPLVAAAAPPSHSKSQQRPLLFPQTDEEQLPAQQRHAQKPKAQDWGSRLLQVANRRMQEAKGPKPDITVGSGANRRQRRQLGPEGEELLGEEEGAEEELGEDAQQPSPPRKRPALPAQMRCFDTARIYVKAGNGGNGCVAFRREKFVDNGGPCGGNGGRGGNVWAVADDQYNSLFNFRSQVHWRAQNGGAGQGRSLTGADAQDLFIPVAPGTIIRRRDAAEDDPPLAELLRPGDRALLLVGGRPGRGNESFKTSQNTAPAFAESGEEGSEAWVDLELKLVADVGIIGVPSAGKSTLLSVISAAKPKIADYPFTTLVPNLGVCAQDFKTTVYADVPGLLEGAHEGLGLGHEFLRHVSRCRALVHVIDGSSPDPVGDWAAINLELELFNPAIKDKPQIIAYNKIDLPDSGEFWEDVREELAARGADPDNMYPMSAATGQGVTELVRAVRGLLDAMGPAKVEAETDALNLTQVPPRRDQRLDDFTIEVEEVPGKARGPQSRPPRVYYVDGEAFAKFAQMTNWNYWEAVRRFQRVLEVAGVNASLKSRGIQEGDSVVIGDTEFEWSDDQSERAMFAAWEADMRARGQARQGAAKWPRGPPLKRG